MNYSPGFLYWVFPGFPHLVLSGSLILLGFPAEISPGILLLLFSRISFCNPLRNFPWFPPNFFLYSSQDSSSNVFGDFVWILLGIPSVTFPGIICFPLENSTRIHSGIILGFFHGLLLGFHQGFLTGFPLDSFKDSSENSAGWLLMVVLVSDNRKMARVHSAR